MSAFSLTPNDVEAIRGVCRKPMADTAETVPRTFAPPRVDAVAQMERLLRRLEVDPAKVRTPGVSDSVSGPIFSASVDFDGTLRHVMEPGSVANLLKANATVILNRFHRADDSYFELVERVGEDRGCEVSANAYLSVAGSRSFGWHYDTHDVVALQLTGEKRWKFAERATTAPAPGDWGVGKVIPAQSSREIDTCPGDALLIPRGLWHDTSTTSATPSLHISISLFALTFDRLVKPATEVLIGKSPANRADLALLPKAERIESIERSLEQLTALVLQTPRTDRAGDAELVPENKE